MEIKCMRILQNFDAETIMNSGQCFRMNKVNGGYSVIHNGHYVEFNNYPFIPEEPEGMKLAPNQEKMFEQYSNVYFSCDEKEFEDVWREYFDVDRCYQEIIESIDENDEFLTKAVEANKGLRILKQDPWEMIVTFIISQNNNIPRIKKLVEALCEKCGEPIDGCNAYAFPTPTALSHLELSELEDMGFGYRSKYLYNVAELVVSGQLDIESLKSMDYESVLNRLKQVVGIGDKVANCIMLFGFHFINAFPIDTHIKQILADYYIDENGNDKFPYDKYDCLGIIQQYMFSYKLNKKG